MSDIQSVLVRVTRAPGGRYTADVMIEDSEHYAKDEHVAQFDSLTPGGAVMNVIGSVTALLGKPSEREVQEARAIIRAAEGPA